jgi:hypothetical protein
MLQERCREVSVCLDKNQAADGVLKRSVLVLNGGMKVTHRFGDREMKQRAMNVHRSE